jgi:hypoxanthine-DNA glycosylase
MSDQTVTHPFAPVADEHSRILILGTMPSVQSREAGFYYAHPRNRFWPVLAACLEQLPPATIEDKNRLLLTNGIALWDVLASCEISASDDSSIRNPLCNDIATLVSDKPIQKILCNGKKTYDYCRGLELSLPVLCLPSTSPANAAWSMERLTAAWKLEIVF